MGSPVLNEQPPAPVPFFPDSAYLTKEPTTRSPLPSTPDLDPPGASQLGLSRQEIDQFRESGFVIKRGLIPEEALAPLLDLWWQQPPVKVAGLKRDDPGTWIDPSRHWPEQNRWGLVDNWMGDRSWPEHALLAWPGMKGQQGELTVRLPHRLFAPVADTNDVWRWHGIGHDPEFVSATSAHPNVLHMAELLMGGPVKRPWRNRGVYSVFPQGDSSSEPRLGCHLDRNMTELVVVTYLDDVPPGGGGFTIWPTSPQRLYPTSEQALHWTATEQSNQAMDDIKRDVQPLEFSGKAGDVIFCYGWVAHSGGIHQGSNIRKAVIQDLNRVRPRSHMRWAAIGKNGGPIINCNMDGLFLFDGDYPDDDPADGDREVITQWIMDSNEFVVSRRPPEKDMFAEWNVGQRPAEGFVVEEPPWWEKYDLPLTPPGTPRGGGAVPAVPLSSIDQYEGEGVWRARSRANAWMRRT